MPFALLLSSHVAASRVGGGVSQRALEARRIDTALVPTVVMGRHPGWGAPGGGPVEENDFASSLDAIAAQGLFAQTDLVLTGYFASVGQITAAAEAIDRILAARPGALIAVDPILGDAPGGLYVPKPVAIAIRDLLLPRAGLITPNAFELGWLTGRTLPDLPSAIRAAQSLDKPVLVSSLPCGTEVGAAYVSPRESWMITHPRTGKAPNGTGDLLTAGFCGALVDGMTPKAALEHAVSATAAIIARAHEWEAPELPIVAAADLLVRPEPLFTAQPLQPA